MSSVWVAGIGVGVVFIEALQRTRRGAGVRGWRRGSAGWKQLGFTRPLEGEGVGLDGSAWLRQAFLDAAGLTLPLPVHGLCVVRCLAAG